MQRLFINIFPNLINILSRVTGRDIYRIDHSLSRRPSLPEKFISSQRIITLNSALTGTPPGVSFAREFLKLSARAIVNYRSTQRWMAYWNSTPILTEIASSTPYVLKKIFRPYMSNRLDCNERLAVLTSHYDFITRHGLDNLILHAATAPVVLSQFSGRSDSTYQVQLVVDCTMEREGELVLQLVNAGATLFSVAFTLFKENGTPTIAIGCLQGGRASNSLEQIRFATRDMFGLRPKTLMVRLVQQIGLQFACRNFLLVGNQNRAVTTQLRKGIVFADYDATWLELDAARRPDGDFTLSCKELPEPDLQAIASNKRSEAKKRYALLSTISQRTCEGLRHPQASD